MLEQQPAEPKWVAVLLRDDRVLRSGAHVREDAPVKDGWWLRRRWRCSSTAGWRPRALWRLSAAHVDSMVRESSRRFRLFHAAVVDRKTAAPPRPYQPTPNPSAFSFILFWTSSPGWKPPLKDWCINEFVGQKIKSSSGIGSEPHHTNQRHIFPEHCTYAHVSG